MISVIVLGTGNVANHLIDAFLKADSINLIQVYGRSKSALSKFENSVETTSKFKSLKDAEVYIITISDDAIPEFSSHLSLKDKLVVHTSGSVAMEALKTTGNKGVFYPLQTFSKDNPVNFAAIPICLETERKEDYKMLEKLASSISDKVYNIDSNQRKYIHLAAVFTNNFVNYMYKIGKDICLENDIPFDILHPLILESAKKIENADPVSIQTGPAKRNDKKTIEKHLKLLKGQKKEIYKLLTQSIKETYGKKL
ncbi:Rossmann-like and DUF2520 domain-containing protein [Aureibaculum sp. 2210JD6-5]|uniref:Rossmann-like and DUF2520 domain-containing protein n=1 Tax=Aureibaculum sp. 2210JD6-5 TaxID=3103957 RepID=UPI002AAE1ED6|nr:Rossmann-like and DUF2520 domain-containing protein [Aureibaculum sp. 2210JD6-5]MDY7396697.1 Rossmann-like and DUF2520 domain-containing protein [Aureibaculum sp. 2210JD6-5]